MPHYQIHITPLEYFFFGSEKHNADLTTNYFVESQPYPQQTTLLGLLRFFLLQKNGLITGKSINNQAAAKNLIGHESFDFCNKIEKDTFGKIKNISPLYFSNGKKRFFFAPLDIKFKMGKAFQLTHQGKDFNAKDHAPLVQHYLISEDFADIFKLDCIVRDYAQVGNEKGEKGQTKENAFYKQNMKRLENDWSFVIDAEIEEEISVNESYFLPFGGEKCFFKLSFQKKNAFNPQYPTSKHERNGFFPLLCLSDCFVAGEKIKQLPFAVNNYVSFRNFRSNVSTKNFDALKKDEKIDDSQIRSSRYQILQRGSVLYFTNETDRDDFAKEMKAQNGFSIGFNHVL